MPVTYELDRDAGYIETRCAGEVTMQEVLGHFAELEADPTLPERLDVFLDLDDMDNLPQSGQMQSAALAAGRLKTKLEWGSCAILASRDGIFGIARMFESFADGRFGDTRVFRDRDEAEAWMREMRKPAA